MRFLLRALSRSLLSIPAPVAALLALCWAALIWRLSSRAVPTPVEVHFVWELLSNLAHAPLFGLLCLFSAALVLRARRGESGPVFARARVAGLLAWIALYGVVDEWHQSRTPGRDPSAYDVVTDLAGAALVLWIASYVRHDASSESGLWLRIAASLALCLGSATLATLLS